MSSKDVKAALKEAREAIKNKDFQTSLKLCKNILRDDKENYMALVFLGLSLQETGSADQASNAFRKAIQLNSSNILGWNGLANYYEKFRGSEAQKELIPIYISLLQLETNNKKLNEVCEKLSTLPLNQEDTLKAIEVLAKIAKNDSFPQQTTTIAWSTLVSIAIKIADLPESSMQIYEEGLSHILSNSKLITKEYYAEYLKVLHKLQKYETLLNEAAKMRNIYDTDVISLEWICKIYNELVIENKALISSIQDKIDGFYETLLTAQPTSSIGLFTKAVVFYKNSNFIEAKDLLGKITNERPGLLHAWILLSSCSYKLYIYSEAASAALKADKLLNSINNLNLSLRKQLDLLLIEVLSRHLEHESLKRGIDICLKLLNKDQDKSLVYCSLIRCYINLDNYPQATHNLSILKSIEHDHSIFTLLNAHLLHKQGQFEKALELLESEKNVNLTEWWYEIGILHWDLKLYEKSLLPFLKAAKLDPNCYLVFLHLGHYYQKFNNPNKARRCYEKAFKINPKCIEAAVELTKLYRSLKNWESNVILLKRVTGDVVDTDNQWAWLQLGLNYLEQGQHDRAIDTLQFVVRANPTNNHCWESLADAYMARGAYLSALKSYQKSVDIAPTLYPLLQIANIKQALSNYDEARADFEVILSNNKCYVPALKGLAETYIQQALLFRKNQRLARARDCAQTAIDALITAIQECNDLSCLWKLAGDCCFLVATLPERYCCLLVLTAFAEGKPTEGNTVLIQRQLYELAERCYHKAVSLQNNVLIWHDLAVCFLSYAQSDHNENQTERLYEKAATIIQYCCSTNPTNWEHWNLMGIIAINRDPKNYALAQHSFIKAVQIEDKSTVAWCNLGTLYFELGDLKLANEAFSQAQRADPNYVNSWVGQALVAESIGLDESMDLFRHSTQLGVQQQGAIGYASWVCRILMESPPHSTIYSIHNMHAIPVACDALTWYTENDPDDPCAWNMLGFLKERMGLKTESAQAFRNALRLCRDNNKDKCRINYGRLLFKLEKYEEAVKVYKDVQEATFNSGSGLALSLFKDEQYEESYEMYEQALHWLTDEQSRQSDLLVALASMAYRFQGPDAAKTLLLQSIQLKPPSPFGFYALLVLGLLHKDLNLSKLALKELEIFQDDPQCIHHYAVLLCYTYLLQDEYTSAVRELSKLIHRHPSYASLWLILSTLLVRVHERRPLSIRAAARCAQLAEKMGRTNMDVTKVLCISSLASYLSEDYERALKAAQRAIHCYPNVAEGWGVLISALTRNPNVSMKLVQRNWVQKVIKHVRERLNPSSPLLKWLQ